METKIIDGQKYACIGCGICCGAWQVHVSPEEEKRLAAIDWSKHDARFSPNQSIIENGLMKKSNKQCLMLESDKRCLIHAKLSYQDKPLTCRQFPILVTETPDEWRITASFCCPGVSRNVGPLLKDCPELVGQVVPQLKKAALKAPVVVTGEANIDWPEFKKIEQDFLAVMDQAGLTIHQKILALYFRSQEIARAKLNQREMKPLDESIASAKTASYPPEKLKGALIRGLFLAFIQEASLRESEHGRVSFVRSFLQETMKLAFGWGTAGSGFGLEVPVSQIEEVRFDGGAPSADERLRRYFRGLIFRGQLLSQQGIVKGTAALVIAFSLVSWFSRLFAASEKRAVVADQDLEKGISYVEQHFAQHSQGVQDLISHGLFAVMFEALLARPAVASSLING